MGLDQHGTKITIWELNRSIQKRTEEMILLYLGSMYRMDIRAGERHAVAESHVVAESHAVAESHVVAESHAVAESHVVAERHVVAESHVVAELHAVACWQPVPTVRVGLPPNPDTSDVQVVLDEAELFGTIQKRERHFMKLADEGAFGLPFSEEDAEEYVRIVKLIADGVPSFDVWPYFGAPVGRT